MEIRCPLCSCPMKLGDDRETGQVPCPRCETRFRVEPTSPWPRGVQQEPFAGFRLCGPVRVGDRLSTYDATRLLDDEPFSLMKPQQGDVMTFEDRRRLVDDARSLAVALEGADGVVRVVAAGEVELVPYLVLEPVAGRSLAARLRARRYEPPEAAALVRRVAEIVQALHERGVAHGNLKPASILIADDGSPRLTEFAVGRRDPGRITVDDEGTLLSSPAYVAPECLTTPPPPPSKPSDVYSLGTILYELLTGEPPFRASQKDQAERIRQGRPTPPRGLNSQIPAALEAVCLKAMSRSPGRRHASAAAMAEALRLYLERAPETHRPGKPPLRWARPAAAALALASIAGAAITVVAVARSHSAARSRADAELREARAAVEASRERASRAEQGRDAASAELSRRELQRALDLGALATADRELREARDAIENFRDSKARDNLQVAEKSAELDRLREAKRQSDHRLATVTAERVDRDLRDDWLRMDQRLQEARATIAGLREQKAQAERERDGARAELTERELRAAYNLGARDAAIEAATTATLERDRARAETDGARQELDRQAEVARSARETLRAELDDARGLAALQRGTIALLRSDIEQAKRQLTSIYVVAEPGSIPARRALFVPTFATEATQPGPSTVLGGEGKPSPGIAGLPATCPRCGRATPAEHSRLGLIFTCPDCGEINLPSAKTAFVVSLPGYRANLDADRAASASPEERKSPATRLDLASFLIEDRSRFGRGDEALHVLRREERQGDRIRDGLARVLTRAPRRVSATLPILRILGARSAWALFLFRPDSKYEFWEAPPSTFRIEIPDSGPPAEPGHLTPDDSFPPIPEESAELGAVAAPRFTPIPPALDPDPPSNSRSRALRLRGPASGEAGGVAFGSDGRLVVPPSCHKSFWRRTLDDLNGRDSTIFPP